MCYHIISFYFDHLSVLNLRVQMKVMVVVFWLKGISTEVFFVEIRCHGWQNDLQVGNCIEYLLHGLAKVPVFSPIFAWPDVYEEDFRLL